MGMIEGFLVLGHVGFFLHHWKIVLLFVSEPNPMLAFTLLGKEDWAN